LDVKAKAFDHLSPSRAAKLKPQNWNSNRRFDIVDHFDPAARRGKDDSGQELGDPRRDLRRTMDIPKMQKIVGRNARDFTFPDAFYL
jgi:hypothetical protein